MYEPKFKLNRRDEARWRLLVAREAVELGPPRKKFPPLTAAERSELEALQRKKRRKLHSHPKMKEIMRWNRHQMRRLNRMSERLEKLFQQIMKSREEKKA